MTQHIQTQQDAQHTETKLFFMFLFENNPRESVRSVFG